MVSVALPATELCVVGPIEMALGGVMSSQAMELTVTCRLLDGRLVSLRRLGADDDEAGLALDQHLTEHDRYYRFFTLNPVHLDQLVSTLIEPANGQYALGAFDGDRLIGVANYTVSDDASVAEIAIVVAHEDHSLGLGTALVKRLAQIARAHGIGHFVADVLAENHLMLMVLLDFGWPCKRKNYGSILHLDIELPECITEASTAAIELPQRQGMRNV
jgi:GNAT superfamily N-acetyltransferase